MNGKYFVEIGKEDVSIRSDFWLPVLLADSEWFPFEMKIWYKWRTS